MTWRRAVATVLWIAPFVLRRDALAPRPVPAIAPALSVRTAALSFEPVRADTDSFDSYFGRGRGFSVLLSAGKLTLRSSSCKEAVTLRFPAAPGPPRTDDPLPGKSNYFLGNDPSRWRTGIPRYAAVRYENIRPGIDLVCHGGKQGDFEYDLVLAPGASADALWIDVDSPGAVSTREDGALSIPWGDGYLTLSLPLAFQTTPDGVTRPVDVRYRVADGRFGFEVASYDRERSLTIDPTLTTSTLLGGDAPDTAQALAVDGEGAIYLTGMSAAGLTATPGAFQNACAGGADAYVTKLTPNAASVVYTTYLGGSGDDSGASIAVDASGHAYLAGQTASSDFPVANAVEGTPMGPQAGFAAMLDASGSTLAYSTYLGGSDVDTATGIAVDSSGSAYVTGQTQSTTFPLANPLQNTIAGGTDVFVTKLAPGGGALVYSTFLGGLHDDEGFAVALDAYGDAFVTGGTFSPDFPQAGSIPGSNSGGAFLFELDPSGTGLSYSTCLGSAFDQGQAVAVDSNGNAFFAGLSTSGLYPTLSPLPGTSELTGTNGFLTKVSPAGATIVYSTLVGGSDFDSATGIALDGSGDAFVTGFTYSTDFPTVAALQTDPITVLNGISAFVSEIKPDDSGFVYSTYLGGSGSTYGYGIAPAAGGGVYVVGATGDLNFPTQDAYQPAFASGTAGSQAFVSELLPGSRPLLAISPSPETVSPFETIVFRASGGSGAGYTFSLYSDRSGGSIDPGGTYRAGSHVGVLDVVEVVDSEGTSAAAAVSVIPAAPDGGMVRDGGASRDAGTSDAGREDARSNEDGGRGDTSDLDADGSAPPVFTAAGSQCAIRASRAAPGYPSALVVLVFPATFLARRNQHRRNPSRLKCHAPFARVPR
jgi:hypothetical protein